MHRTVVTLKNGMKVICPMLIPVGSALDKIIQALNDWKEIQSVA